MTSSSGHVVVHTYYIYDLAVLFTTGCVDVLKDHEAMIYMDICIDKDESITSEDINNIYLYNWHVNGTGLQYIINSHGLD